MPSWSLEDVLSSVSGLLNSQPRKALEMATSAVQRTKDSGDRLGEMRALYHRGACHRILSEAQEALEDFYDSLNLAQSLGHAEGEMKALTGVGSIFAQLSRFDRALDQFFRAQSLAQSSGNLEVQFTTLSQIGEVHLTLGHLKEALECFQETYDLVHQVNDREHLATCLSNLGLTYLALKHNDKALEHLSRALVVYKEMDNRLGEARTLTYIGLIYRSIGELEISEEYHQQGLKTFLRLDNKMGQMEAYSHLAELAGLRNQGEKHLWFLERLLGLSAEIDSKFFSARAYRALADYWEKAGEHKKALEYLHQAHTLDNYLKEEELNRSARSLQIQLDFERSQAEAEILRLKTVSLERQSQELRQSFQTLQALGEIGRGITATLKVGPLMKKIYEILQGLVDTSIFGIGLYKKKKNLIHFKFFMEKGHPLAPFKRPLEGPKNFSAYCLQNRQSLLIRDLKEDGAVLLGQTPDEPPGPGPHPQSLIYLPLLVQDKVIGLLTVQSYEKDRYKPHDLEMLETLGGYISVALENALSHKKLKKLFTRLAQDKEDLERAAQQIEHMANHDLLTGLANRRMLGEFMTKTLSYCQRNAKSFAVFFMDLDGFKPVNDSLGHEAGDLVLQEISRRLAGVLRDSDLVARVGGDEFVALVLDVGNPEDAEIVGKKILEAVALPVQVQNNFCRLATSIGVAFYPQDGEDRDTLLQKADHAMYEVKRQGKNGIGYAGAPEKPPRKRSSPKKPPESPSVD